MTKLWVTAGIVFALDLVVLALMVRDLLVGEFGDADRGVAVGLTQRIGALLVFGVVVLVASWWRESRFGLWVALVCGALPLLWVWSVIVQDITEWAATRQ